MRNALVRQGAHAGLKVDPPEMNDMYTMIHDHDVVLQNRYAGPLTVVGHIALAKPAWFAGDGETTEEIPYGVWRELPAGGFLCIDTGCGKGGCLTGMICEGGRFRLEKADRP